MNRWALIEAGTVSTVVEQAEMPTTPGTWVASATASTGWSYNGSVFAAPESLSFCLDVGPFFDRFNHFNPLVKLNILSSTDVQVQAVIKDLQVRKWVDLTRPDVAGGIDLLIAKGISGVDSTLKNWILTTPSDEQENLALRKQFFN